MQVQPTYFSRTSLVLNNLSWVPSLEERRKGLIYRPPSLLLPPCLKSLIFSFAPFLRSLPRSVNVLNMLRCQLDRSGYTLPKSETTVSTDSLESLVCVV